MNNCWWEDPEFNEALTLRPTRQGSWDAFFMNLAYEASQMSKCASRKVGAVIVRGTRIISFGFNGSPAGSSLCQDAGYCPRRKLGIPSGQGIELCPAQHGEENAIHSAARVGISTEGATMYCYCGVPCQRCAGAIINAGIKEVVCLNGDVYDGMCLRLFEDAGVVVSTIDKHYKKR
jgi:dCMP deaminase